ncbi:recombinase family protein [Priestia megaterium]|uniref:Recombinase family protein n=1 Tax=Priestia megaterium TaxID=1404 RepID=A0A6M6DJK5_PRIMG|nr:recombinase family protein [Priestia megaterium]QJX74730.1 hypothetical protein FDZ14_00490 [Priestia megaterium]
MKKAFAYYRKSIERDSVKSIDGQREEVHKYATENNIEIIQEFSEVASSASLFREELIRMFEELKKRNDIDFILVYRFDRMTREIEGFGWILAQLKDFHQVKTRLHSITEDNDYVESPEKLLLQTMKTYGSTMEREAAVARMYEGKIRKSKKGGFLGGTPPLGYRSVPGTGKLAVNEEEAPLVRQVFALKETGLSMNAIAKELNELGFISRKGGKFHAKTIQRIIKHERLYRGEYEDPSILN